jgi:hypothetical protein
MKNLERFIKNNLPAFDEEPASGHFERLQAKWEHTRRRTKTLTISQLAAAACLAAVVTVIALVYDRPAATSPEIVVLCENAADMKSCYLSKMNDVAAQIQKMAETLDSIDPQEVMMEVDNLLATGDDIELALPDELPDDAAKAMKANYYQRHLESLQSIAQQISDF